MKKLLLTHNLILVISIASFFMLPESVELLAFSGKALFNLEIWRILTFPFAHISITHLLENILGLSMVTILAYELRLKWHDYFAAFFLTGILIALPEGIFLPSLVIAGASLGIYAILGTLSIKGSNYIPKKYSIPLIGGSVFLSILYKYFTSTEIPIIEIASSSFHLLGFVGGIALFYVLVYRRATKQPHILTGGIL